MKLDLLFIFKPERMLTMSQLLMRMHESSDMLIVQERSECAPSLSKLAKFIELKPINSSLPSPSVDIAVLW